MSYKIFDNSSGKIATTLTLLFLSFVIVTGCKSITGSDDDSGSETDLSSTEVQSSLGDSNIQLAWNQVDNADSYNIYRSKSSTDEVAGNPLASEVAETTYTDTEIQPGSSYFYRVTPLQNGKEGPSSEEIKVTNFTVDPIETNRLVGTHYYLWFNGENNWTNDTKNQPVLGNYGSDNSQVINQHIKWALEHGIQWFSIGWAGPDHDATKRLENGFLQAKFADQIKFSILYETKARLQNEGPINMSRSEKANTFRDDLEYLKEHYFDRENYMHIDGQPVLFVYFSHALFVQEENIFSDILNEAGVDPYIIAGIPSPSSPDEFPISEVTDAFSTYNPYSAWPEIQKTGMELYEAGINRLHLSANDPNNNWDFFPVAIPGIRNDQEKTFKASPDKFRQVTQMLDSHLNDAKATLITSFNNWTFDTQIEPSDQYGKEYLNIVKNNLATGSIPSYEPPTGTFISFDWEKALGAQEVDPNAEVNRHLSFSVHKLILKNAAGDILRNYNIGKHGEEPFHINGIDDRESNDHTSWRWFGGWNAYSKLLARDVENIDSIILEGRAIENMDVTVSIGNQSVTKEVKAGGIRTYEFNF